MAYDRDGYVKAEYMGEKNIKEDTEISGRAKNMEKKK